MTPRIRYEDLQNKGFDEGGEEILYYQGRPFTGVVLSYDNDKLITEDEYSNGHPGGMQREYYPNGQLRVEAFIRFNDLYGIARNWDEQGNLTWEKDFGPGPHFP